MNLKCLSALLNSRLAAFWLKHMGKMQGTNYQVDKEPLLAMPIYRPPDQEQEPLMSLVDRVLAVTTSEGYISRKAEQAEVRELERRIDHMVYQLYDLTAEEIAVVEGNSGR